MKRHGQNIWVLFPKQLQLLTAHVQPLLTHSCYILQAVPVCLNHHRETSCDFTIRINYSCDYFYFYFLNTAYHMTLLSLPRFFFWREPREKKWDKPNSKTWDSCWNQTPDSVCVYTVSLCLWRAFCPPSQPPFPWPCYWHWTVICRLSE